MVGNNIDTLEQSQLPNIMLLVIDKTKFIF